MCAVHQGAHLLHGAPNEPSCAATQVRKCVAGRHLQQLPRTRAAFPRPSMPHIMSYAGQTGQPEAGRARSSEQHASTARCARASSAHIGRFSKACAGKSERALPCILDLYGLRLRTARHFRWRRQSGALEQLSCGRASGAPVRKLARQPRLVSARADRAMRLVQAHVRPQRVVAALHARWALRLAE